jgi:hypothetical protein
MNEVAVDMPKGIKETSEAVVYFIHAIKVGSEILEDEKLAIDDFMSMLNLFKGLNEAISGGGDIPAEIKDLDLEELDALIQVIVTNYNFESEKAKLIVEKSLVAVRANYEVYLLLKG